MKKRFGCILSVILLLAALPSVAQVKWSKEDLPSTLATAQKSKSFVLLDFFATWCGPCKLLDSETWEKASVGDFFAQKHIMALKVDVDKDAKTSKRYGIRAMPTVVLVNGNGEEINRFMGFRGPEKVLGFLKDSLKDPRTRSQLRAAVKKDPGDLKDAAILASRIIKANPRGKDVIELRKLLDMVIKGDPDNSKNLGAGAVANRVAIGVTEALGGRLGYVNRMLGSLSTKAPDLIKSVPDEKTGELRGTVLKSWKDYLDRIRYDCTVQLHEAIKTAKKMKNPNANADALVEAEGYITGGRYADRDLCEAYYLFEAAITKDPNALNSAAWYFYISQTHLDLALKLARTSIAARENPMVEDTLAHLLFSRGQKDEAIRIEEKAMAKLKEMKRMRSAASYQKAIDSWKKGVADQLLAPVGKDGKKSPPENAKAPDANP